MITIHSQLGMPLSLYIVNQVWFNQLGEDHQLTTFPLPGRCRANEGPRAPGSQCAEPVAPPVCTAGNHRGVPEEFLVVEISMEGGHEGSGVLGEGH